LQILKIKILRHYSTKDKCKQAYLFEWNHEIPTKTGTLDLIRTLKFYSTFQLAETVVFLAFRDASFEFSSYRVMLKF
jgi:hypothetical protein